jgi:hypothetical protein
MKLQVTGTILKVVTETGVSSKGNEWTKHNVVIVDSENKELQITFFDSQGNFSYLPKSEGETLIAECELTSREYKGKYYTQVNGLGILNKKESVYKAVVQGKELTAEFDRKVIEDDLPF